MLRKRGFNVFALALIAALFGLTTLSGCASKEKATETMKAWVQEMGWEYVGGSCTDTDSDNDGYVSCTANVREDADGPTITKDLQCAGGAMFSRTGGCKASMPKVNVKQ